MTHPAERDMNTGKKHGFTLMESAVVLIIIGLLAVVLVPTIVNSIRREKVSQGKLAVAAIRDQIIGYAIDNRKLPDNEDATSSSKKFSDVTGNPDDAWGRSFRYLADTDLVEAGSLASICGKDAVDVDSLSVRANPDTGAPDVENVAFIVVSDGENHTPDVELDAPPADPTADITDPGDDLVEFVTLGQLKALLDCGVKAAPEDALATFDGSNVSGGVITTGGTTPLSGTVSATLTTDPVTGAFIFDSTTDSVTITSSAAYDSLTAYTVSGWFSATTSGGSGIRHITAKGSSATSYTWWVRLVNGNITFSFVGEYSNSTSAARTIETTSASADSEWHFFAASVAQYESDLMGCLYIDANGPICERFLDQTLHADSGYIYVGTAAWNTARVFLGLIDDIRIYDYALEAAQVGAIYTLEKSNHP